MSPCTSEPRSPSCANSTYSRPSRLSPREPTDHEKNRDRRGRHVRHSPHSEIGRGVLRRISRGAALARRRCSSVWDSGRGRDGNSVRGGPAALGIRSRRRGAMLANLRQARCSSSFRARTWLRPTSVAGTALPWSESQMRRMRERFTDTTRSAQPSYQPGGSLAGKLSSDVSPTGSRRRGATILDYAPPSVMNRSAP
jgi:hypothetical protein